MPHSEPGKGRKFHDRARGAADSLLAVPPFMLLERRPVRNQRSERIAFVEEAGDE
jgi:hypothetical protein